MRYLTKSRFKMALECPTKLYYTRNEAYSDLGEDDPFMQQLAKGGYQIGEFAKYKYCADPIGQSITIETLNPSEALRLTQERLNTADDVVIAEGAFQFENLFIRADLVVKTGNTLKLIEVKSKSIDNNAVFWKKNGSIRSDWVPYFYDVAFQTYVLEKAMPGFDVKPYLLLVDKDAVSTRDGLNQLFKVSKDAAGRVQVITQPGLTAEGFGDFGLLREIPMREAVYKLFSIPVPNKLVPKEHSGLEDFIRWSAELYQKQIRHWCKPSNQCKKCNFKRGDSDKKCGFSECWSNHEWSILGKISQEQLNLEPNVTQLWMGGGGNVSSKVILQNVPFVSMLEPEGLRAIKPSKTEYLGMSPFERREHQILAARGEKDAYVFYKTEFQEAHSEWKYPLNMIDFETSTTALPYFKGLAPYETVAFQFSHHIMHADGRVEHFNDFISWEQGKYPNLDFIRALKQSLESNVGTIFRYATHENSVLNKIKRDIAAINPADKDALLEFIDSITDEEVNNKKRWGHRNMVDLAEMVRNFYYSTVAGGSNSIKKILPAIIHDCPALIEKYSNENLYGKGREFNSRNFQAHTWIKADTNFDPYKTLLPITRFDGIQEIEIFDDLGEVADGSSAMTAYNKLQWTDISETERLALKEALLGYCELDTLAMVMLVQGLLLLEEKR